jgi:hypothetical protein
MCVLYINTNYYYDSIQISTSDTVIKDVQMFTSKYFSNLNVPEVNVRIPKRKEIYITGIVQDRCTGEISKFYDTVFIPKALLDARK